MDKSTYRPIRFQATSRAFKEDLDSIRTDRYYLTYKPIRLLCILFIFIEIKFILSYSCVMFICNKVYEDR